MARIELDGITRRFGKLAAVADLDLDIENGSFTALLGPSGCGKSTTMNVIAGLLQPTEGEVRFDGQRVNEQPPGKRNVGFVFQSYAIFPHMTAYENIAFGLRVRGTPETEVEQEVQRVAELLGLTELIRRSALELSVNDLQKVAIGRSMITNPRIFLLDEPFSNLDAAFRAYMRAELKRLQGELRQTMIYVTHDQVEAMAMADRIAVMHDGRLQQFDTPERVYNHPANRFVAGFVGSIAMNFLVAEVTGSNGSLVVQPGCADATAIALDCRERPANGADVSLGVRPEHLRPVEPTQEADLRGEIILLEPLGARTIVHVRSRTEELRTIVAPSVQLRVGDSIGLTFDRERVHVFDSDGRTLH